MGQRGKDRLAKEDMRRPGIGKDGRRSNRTEQGRMVRVVVGIVRFQDSERIGVRETRGWGGVIIVGGQGKVV